MNRTAGILVLLCLAVLLSGCGISQEKLAEQGIYTELYSAELLAEKIEAAVLEGSSTFEVTYYGNIEDLDALGDMTWKTGYVNKRYVERVDVDYREAKGYVTAHYTVYTKDGDLLKAMPADKDGLKVYPMDFDGIDCCITDMMERRADTARYLVESGELSADMYSTLNDLLYDYQNKSYIYPYMVSSLSWTVADYDGVTELELFPVYREGAKKPEELPRASSIGEYIQAVSEAWNLSCGSSADVIMENLPLTEAEIFDALMIAEANAALMPCEAGEVSYMQYSGHGDMYILSASLSVPFKEADLVPLYEELTAKVSETAEDIMAEHTDEKDRYRAAYRAVTDAAEYSDDIAEATEVESVTDTMRIMRSAYGALVEGKTVCTGYAKAYKALCDYMELECIMINGTQEGVGHAWNMVILDGEPYYVDCTYGDTGGGSGYCLFSGEKLKERDYVIDEEYSVYGLA